MTKDKDKAQILSCTNKMLANRDGLTPIKVCATVIAQLEDMPVFINLVPPVREISDETMEQLRNAARDLRAKIMSIEA